MFFGCISLISLPNIFPFCKNNNSNNNINNNNSNCNIINDIRLEEFNNSYERKSDISIDYEYNNNDEEEHHYCNFYLDLNEEQSYLNSSNSKKNLLKKSKADSKTEKKIEKDISFIFA